MQSHGLFQSQCTRLYQNSIWIRVGVSKLQPTGQNLAILFLYKLSREYKTPLLLSVAILCYNGKVGVVAMKITSRLKNFTIWPCTEEVCRPGL